MKKIYLLLSVLSFSIYNSQNSFEYERVWGTYLGPVGSRGHGWIFNAQPLFIDIDDNIYVEGSVNANSNYPASYYNQFIMGNSQSYLYVDPNTISNFSGSFNSSGNKLHFDYHTMYNNVVGSYSRHLMHIDNSGNKYYQYGAINSTYLPVNPTAGTWSFNQSGPDGRFGLLAKYSPSGVLLWAAGLPSYSVRIEVDPSENVYISGLTKMQSNLTTPGVFQETYQSFPNFDANGYLAKLTSNGAVAWVTYYPGFASVIKYHNNSLYMMISQVPQGNQLQLTTPGAFQTSQSTDVILKMNAGSGSRIWGTYYGLTNGQYQLMAMEVNDSGIYFQGNSIIDSGNYFGTPGSFQPTKNGSVDLFLSKFSHNGERIWSTYFGTSGLDTSQGSQKPLSLAGDDIYICGVTTGQNSNLATPSAYQQFPTQNNSNSTNQFFAKFNSDGAREWSSYYGGSSVSFNEPINILVSDSSLYVYGSTTSQTGFATTGAAQTAIIDPYPLSTGIKNAGFLAKFTLKSALSTAEVKQTDTEIYPNPVLDILHIRSKIKYEQIQIYDVAQRCVLTAEIKGNKANLASLAAGNYIVILKNKEISDTFKILKR